MVELHYCSPVSQDTVCDVKMEGENFVHSLVCKQENNSPEVRCEYQFILVFNIILKYFGIRVGRLE